MLLDATTLRTEPQHVIKPQSSTVTCFHFNHNGTLLVAGFADGMVRITDIRTRSFIMGWQAHQVRLRAVQFSGDETTVFSSCNDGTLTRWNAHNLGQPVTQNPIDTTVPDYAMRVPGVLDFALDQDNGAIEPTGLNFRFL